MNRPHRFGTLTSTLTTTSRPRRALTLVSTAFLALTSASCSKGGGATANDGASDGTGEHPVVLCAAVDDSVANPEGGSVTDIDEFGPHAPAAKSASSIGRVNIYEIATPSLLERADVYLRADLDHTRLTIAVQEATSRTSPFHKLADIQIDVAACEGWASSGPLAIPLEAGRYYALGFDPNQAIVPFVSPDIEVLPIDGAFGRLIGSKASSSVSIAALTWDKFSDKEFNRQRLVTSGRPDAAAPSGTSDGGGDAPTVGDAADAARDAAAASGG